MVNKNNCYSLIVDLDCLSFFSLSLSLSERTLRENSEEEERERDFFQGSSLSSWRQNHKTGRERITLGRRGQEEAALSLFFPHHACIHCHKTRILKRRKGDTLSLSLSESISISFSERKREREKRRCHQEWRMFAETKTFQRHCFLLISSFSLQLSPLSLFSFSPSFSILTFHSPSNCKGVSKESKKGTFCPR